MMRAPFVESFFRFPRPDVPPIGLGLLRFSVQDRPVWDDALRVIHHALNRGVRIFDTADSYCLDNKEFHYGERLLRAALDTWDGPREEVRIVTKVGLVRPSGKWVPNGRPEHIARSVEASLGALGCNSLFSVQLHVRDPKVPLNETMGALRDLQSAGKIEHIGCCNLTAAELREASRTVSIATIQDELSVFARSSAEHGLVVFAETAQVPFLAYRPFGGVAKSEKLKTNRSLSPIAKRMGISEHELALALLLRLSPAVVPLVGPTTFENIDSCVRACGHELQDDDFAVLKQKISFEPDEDAVASFRSRSIPAAIPTLDPETPIGERDREVVLVMGIQGAGKTSIVNAYLEHGYERLNRDDVGGKLEDLLPMMERYLEEGGKRVVLDNTYPTRVSRAGVIRVAWKFGLPVRCLYLETALEDARRNIVQRILERYGRLLGPDEFKSLAKSDSNLPPPAALKRYQDTLEEPELDEGFSLVERVPFVRRPLKEAGGKALFLDVDGTIRITKSGELYPRSPEDVDILPRRREVLARWVEAGYELFFLSNQSGIASGKLKEEDAKAAFARTVELLGLPVREIVYCPHPAFPVGCFCRKPLPGLGVYLGWKYQFDFADVIMVGDMDSDAAFAHALGVSYHDAEEFFQSDSMPPVS